MAVTDPARTAKLLVTLSQSQGRLVEEDLQDLIASQPSAEFVRALGAAFELRQKDEDLDARLTKEVIAATLVIAGVKDERYPRLLSRYADEAATDRSPLYYVYDDDGNALRGKMSSEFLQWCSEHGKDPRLMARRQLFAYATDMRLLGESGDPSAPATLKRGLQSPNHAVVLAAVWGLVRVGNPSDVGAIVEASRKLAPIERRLAWEMIEDSAPPGTAAQLDINVQAGGRMISLKPIAESRKPIAARWAAFWEKQEVPK